MALKIIDYGTSDYQKMVKMREDILRKPLGLTFSTDELQAEKNNLLIGAFEDDQMLGCCMIVEKSPDKAQLRQVAVLNNLQGKGIGRALILFAENLARDHGYKTMCMDARKNTVPFFEKMGYKTINPEFIKLTIPHFAMEKEL
jgi:N-acetylglutamate synthase-like GNAT family acetyltransferase